MRREWIEILLDSMLCVVVLVSPSMRREWIEIAVAIAHKRVNLKSPSMRREWIEMEYLWQNYIAEWVSLHAEGVD